MKMRTLGRTGLNISEIGFGAWGIGGGWGATDDAEAKRALHRFLDLGGNLIDTAYGYGDGHSESVIGEVLRERNNTPFGDMFLVRLGGLIIEVLAPDRPDSGLAQIIEKRGEGIDSVGFSVDDIAAVAGAMEADGVRFTSKDERLAWVHPKNPLSISIELLNSAQVQLAPQP